MAVILLFVKCRVILARHRIVEGVSLSLNYCLPVVLFCLLLKVEGDSGLYRRSYEVCAYRKSNFHYYVDTCSFENPSLCSGLNVCSTSPL